MPGVWKEHEPVPIYPYGGHVPRIHPDAWIAPNATIIGDVIIEAHASIWFGAVVRGDVATIRIGERSNIQDNCVLHADEGIPCTVGPDCTVGHAAIVHGATIGAGTLVGMGARVLNSADIGAGCLVAADTLITEGTRIPAGQVVMGSPGRVKRPTSAADRDRIAEGVRHYLERASRYRAQLNK